MDPTGFKVKQIYIDNGLAWWMCLFDHPKSFFFLVLKEIAQLAGNITWHKSPFKFTTQNNKESVQTKRKSFASHLWFTKRHTKIFYKYKYIYIIYITDVYNIHICVCNTNMINIYIYYRCIYINIIWYIWYEINDMIYIYKASLIQVACEACAQSK